MNDQTFATEFGALTDAEQAATVGGDGGGFFYAVGYAIGYSWGCLNLAIQAQTDYMNHQPIFLLPN